MSAAILLLLVVASIPIGLEMRDSAHAANCMSILRQLGAVMIMYAGDHGHVEALTIKEIKERKITYDVVR